MLLFETNQNLQKIWNSNFNQFLNEVKLDIINHLKSMNIDYLKWLKINSDNDISIKINESLFKESFIIEFELFTSQSSIFLTSDYNILVFENDISSIRIFENEISIGLDYSLRKNEMDLFDLIDYGFKFHLSEDISVAELNDLFNDGNLTEEEIDQLNIFIKFFPQYKQEVKKAEKIIKYYNKILKKSENIDILEYDF